MKVIFTTVLVGLSALLSPLRAQTKSVYPGADEKTPSRPQYFNWINSTNEGTNESQTLINLDFFAWMQQTYGMNLDIYAFDAGVVDGKRFYGSMESERFHKKFPNGFAGVASKAKAMNVSLGLWGGPDGFGDTPESAAARKKMMISLCRDYGFKLFKMDGVCGNLRTGKDVELVDMLEQCRKYSPDLILLNHRLNLGKAMPHATTYLWEGRETYIDVFTQNETTAPHNRAGALSIGLTPNLERLVEDCGVCLSSCLDFWDDELVLQAFNRSLILAPEIYGNPWLLRDDEYPKLARLFNLHKRYAKILVNGMKLPEKYGPNAVSRGDARTRILTFKNLDWSSREFTVCLDKEIGLLKGKKVYVKTYHPTEKVIGSVSYGEKVKLEVPPFRTMLLLVTTDKKYMSDWGVEGTDYEVVRDVPGTKAEIKLKGLPGTTALVKIPSSIKYKRAVLDGKDVTEDIRKGLSVSFKGKQLELPVHRKLIKLEKTAVQADAATLYETTVFAADNNALEVRSLYRSGETSIPEVKAARDAFFSQPTFVDRGIWDKNLFDGDMRTAFWPSRKYGVNQRVKNGCFRLDLGENLFVDSLIVKVNDAYALEPLLTDEGNYAYISSDLSKWERITYISGKKMLIPVHSQMRYLKLNPFPEAIAEIEVYSRGRKVDAAAFRASNLFADSKVMKCESMWKGTFVLNELADNSYLSVALNGKHGIEGAYAAIKIDGKMIGSPSRAVSYPSNTWEYVNVRADSNYTYYFPLSKEMIGKKIEVFVMGYDKNNLDFVPEVWISSYRAYDEKMLEIDK